jgi:HSP20 family protein
MNTQSSNAMEASEKQYLPAVDAYETADELVLVADMPGVTPESLEVTVEEGVLTLLGRVTAPAIEGERWIQREFVRGDYYRQFRIPRDFLADRIDASMKAGVVTIRIPRAEKTKPRKIDVRVE